MTATFTVEQRRAINATMTSVVRATQAKHGIDADRFRRDLAAEFDACVRTSGIDLGPLWQRLTTSHKADKLYGLFVAFDSALSPLGVHVSLPADVLRLSKVARAAFVREYLAGAQLQVPRPPGHDEWLSTHLTPLPMKVDLRVLRALPKNTSEAPMPAATRQRLAEGIAWAFKESDLGGSINSGQVAALVVQNFDRLNDGGVFNLAALTDVISTTTNAAQAQLYIPLRRIQNLLPVFGLKPAEIRLQIDQITIQRLEAACGQLPPLSARYRPPRVAEPVRPTKPTSSSSPKRSSGPTKMTVDAVPRVQQGGANIGRMVALALVFILAIAGLWMMPRDSELDLGRYADTVPMTRVHSKQGSFYGQLDEAAWRQLSPEARKAAIEKLEVVLTEENLLREARVYDANGGLAIFGTRKGALVASKAILSMGQ